MKAKSIMGGKQDYKEGEMTTVGMGSLCSRHATIDDEGTDIASSRRAPTRLGRMLILSLSTSQNLLQMCLIDRPICHSWPVIILVRPRPADPVIH